MSTILEHVSFEHLWSFEAEWRLVLCDSTMPTFFRSRYDRLYSSTIAGAITVSLSHWFLVMAVPGSFVVSRNPYCQCLTLSHTSPSLLGPSGL